jgi:hypothetical protein
MGQFGSPSRQTSKKAKKGKGKKGGRGAWASRLGRQPTRPGRALTCTVAWSRSMGRIGWATPEATRLGRLGQPSRARKAARITLGLALARRARLIDTIDTGQIPRSPASTGLPPGEADPLDAVPRVWPATGLQIDLRSIGGDEPALCVMCDTSQMYL